MRKLCFTALFLALLSCEGAQQSKPIVPVPFSDVRIEDSFWSPRLQAHKDVTLAVCIDQIENQTGRIRNYENAAKGRGEHSGIFFDDSDVYKALELMKAEVAKGLPIILLIHIPLYTPEFCAVELEATGGNCAYLTGVPLEITETFDPGNTYPEGQEWRYRKVQQRADTPTLEFIAWLKEQPLLKGILCGHMHRFFEERFSPTAIQYCVGATFNGDAQVAHFV